MLTGARIDPDTLVRLRSPPRDSIRLNVIEPLARIRRPLWARRSGVDVDVGAGWLT